MAQNTNLSQEQVKIGILSYLYDRDGANQHDLQFRAISGHMQEASRFKRILDELCQLEQIAPIDMSHVTKGRVIYKITEKGKKTVEVLRDPLMKDVFGLSGQEI